MTTDADDVNPFRRGYLAGAESRQAEIDNLQHRLEKAETNLKVENKAKINALTKNRKLRKDVNELWAMLEATKKERDSAVYDAVMHETAVERLLARAEAAEQALAIAAGLLRAAASNTRGNESWYAQVRDFLAAIADAGDKQK